MQKYMTALLLAGNKLNKRQYQVTVALCLYYSKYKRIKVDTVNSQITRLTYSDITDLAGYDTYQIELILESLCELNIVGSISYKNNVSSRQLERGLQTEFIQSLGVIAPSSNGKEKKAQIDLICKACDRAHFFISDDSKAYIFNPNITTWKYPSYKKIKRGLANIKKNFNLPEVNDIRKTYKKGRAVELVSKEDYTVSYLIRQFVGRFKEYYNQTKYSMANKGEVGTMRLVLTQFQENGYTIEDIVPFFHWAFETKKNKIVTISFLRYLLNEYLANKKKQDDPVKNYTEDAWGNRTFKRTDG